MAFQSVSHLPSFSYLCLNVADFGVCANIFFTTSTNNLITMSMMRISMSSSILDNAARSLAGIVEIAICSCSYAHVGMRASTLTPVIYTNTRDMLENVTLKVTYSVAIWQEQGKCQASVSALRAPLPDRPKHQ